MMLPLDALTAATYALLLASVLALWAPGRFAWSLPLAAAVGFGYASGVLSGPAILPLVGLALGCRFYRAHGVRTVVAGLAVLVIALGLGMHAFPGFTNPVLLSKVTLSPGAAPYTLYLNFDKTVAGVLILGLCYAGLLAGREAWARMLRQAAPVALVNIAVVVGLALALGYVHIDPKWTVLFWPWAVVNLFFTCVAEEAFFRGLIQRQINERFTFRYKAVVAVGVSAVLFGLAHAAGGPAYVLLSIVAGLGYALAFQLTRRIEASILAHFSLNAVHFLLLTYPRVA